LGFISQVTEAKSLGGANLGRCFDDNMCGADLCEALANGFQGQFGPVAVAAQVRQVHALELG
jgi:hypothetical protein